MNMIILSGNLQNNLIFEHSYIFILTKKMLSPLQLAKLLRKRYIKILIIKKNITTWQF